MLGFYTPHFNSGVPRSSSGKLPDDWPDYMVYMAREALKSVAGSMNEICSGTENYFFQMNRILTYERTMRDFASWTLPGAAPWMAAMPQSWTGFYPHQLGTMPAWQPHQKHFPLMGVTPGFMPSYAYPPYLPGLPPYYAAVQTPSYPSLWSFNPYLTRYM
jgi:hypothetical protein